MPPEDDFVAELIPLDRPRALTDKEGALIAFLLSARVVGVCNCGCPSVTLEVDPSVPAATYRAEETPLGRTDAVPLTAYQEKSRGSTEVTLHVLNGRLFELEIWAHAHGIRPRVDPAKLEHYEWPAL